MNFQLTSTASNGSFDLIDSHEVLITHFQYENWFSSTGSANIQHDLITITPRNFWHSAFDVLVNGVHKGEITFNWQGHILIRLDEQSGLSKNYRLKSRGFWELRFVLEDEQHMELLQLSPKFRWSKLSYNYGANFAETFSPTTNIDLIILLLACGYGANLYMTMMAAA